MNNVQKNRILAERVMGWEIVGSGKNACYSKGAGNQYAKVAFADWHPTTDTAQALMCARKYVNSESGIYTEMDINISPNGIDVSVSKYKEGVDDGTPPIFYCLKSGNVGEEALVMTEALIEAIGGIDE